MNWRKVYIQIIRNAQLQNRSKQDNVYYEGHHILPKSLYPNWTHRKSNIVLLTAREHLFCHMLLVKIYPNSHEMWSALWYMSSKSKSKESNYPKLSLKEYEYIKEGYSMSNSKNLKGKKNPNMARQFSPETRKLIGEKSKGNTNTKGRTWWTNGTESCMAFECPGEGWVKGRNTKGRPAWNKGVPQTEEQRKKNSETHKGKTPWNKGKKGLQEAWNKGKKMSKEFCENCKNRPQNKNFGNVSNPKIRKEK